MLDRLFFVFVRVASWCYDVSHLLPIRYDHNYPRVLRVLKVLTVPKVISGLKVPSVLRVSNIERITTLLPLNNPFMPLLPLLLVR